MITPMNNALEKFSYQSYKIVDRYDDSLWEYIIAMIFSLKKEKWLHHFIFVSQYFDVAITFCRGSHYRFVDAENCNFFLFW